MSPRIVHGPSSDIKTIRIVNQGSAQTTTFEGRPFKGMRVADSYTSAEVQQKMDEARVEGKREGFEEARTQLNGPLRDGLQTVETILDEASKFRRELFKESEEEILDLIRAICKKVLGREVSIDPNTLKDIVVQALKHLEHQKKVQVRLNRDDLERFQSVKEDFLKELRGLEELEFIADEAQAAGTASLKTATTTVDVRLDETVDQLLNSIRQEAKGSSQVNDEGDRLA